MILTKSDHPGVEHVGWRVEKPEDLGAHEKRLEELGLDYHWIEGGEEAGQGDGLRFMTPGGMPFELYWEREAYARARGAPLASRLPSHPQKFPSRGVAPRRFDHMNFLVDKPGDEQEWMTRELASTTVTTWRVRRGQARLLALAHEHLARDRGATQPQPERRAPAPRGLLPRLAGPVAAGGRHPGRQRYRGGVGAGQPRHERGAVSVLFRALWQPRRGLDRRLPHLRPQDWEPIGWTQEKAELAYEFWGSAMPDTYLTYGTASHFTGVPARSTPTPG